jgi:hypothetical protein
MTDKPRKPSQPPSREHGKPDHDQMADPTVHDGAAQQPGGPEPDNDRRQGHRSQTNSI